MSNLRKLDKTPCKSLFSTIEIPPSPFMKKLGYGTGVNVFLLERGTPHRYSYASPWAVKKINSKLKGKLEHVEYKNRLHSEADILKHLSHPNIIGYRAFAQSSDGTDCLVMELGEISLSDLIEQRLEKDLGPFPVDNILKVAKELSCALKYLHDEQHILHGDLKSANVLVKGDFELVKLCDFGVCLYLNKNRIADTSKQCYIGTECWSAPEAIIGGTITDKSDMFSFGLILWEMLSLSPPHVDKLSETTFLSFNSKESFECPENVEDDDEYVKALGTRPALPKLNFGKEFLLILEIFYSCTEESPAKRPSATAVYSLIK